jgi:beta-galactosidase
MPTLWNVYREQTFSLPRRLSGILTVILVFHARNHFRGFVFEKQNKAFARLPVRECDSRYGDGFAEESWGFSGIRNNVVLVFHGMDFDEPANRVILCGRTDLDHNPILLQGTDSKGTRQVQTLEFTRSTWFEPRLFHLDPLEGELMIEFIFLPGSHFDFQWFRFLRPSDPDYQDLDILEGIRPSNIANPVKE